VKIFRTIRQVADALISRLNGSFHVVYHFGDVIERAAGMPFLQIILGSASHLGGNSGEFGTSASGDWVGGLERAKRALNVERRDIILRNL
jgi:hypothetical protein